MTSGRTNINFGFTVTLITFILSFWYVRYTSDWGGYETFYYNPEMSPDYFFQKLSDIFRSYSLEYKALFRFHIVVSAFLFLTFISRFLNKYFFVYVMLMLASYVFIGNMIRYYVAFPLMLHSCYYLFVKKNIFLHLLLAILAILNHKAIGLFFPLFYFVIFIKDQMLNPKTAWRIIVLLNPLGFIGINIVSIFLQGHFSEYFQPGFTGSILGGIYNFMSSVIMMTFLYNIFANVYYKAPELLKDKKLQFLLLLSYCSSFLILASLNYLIITHRYITTMFLIWLIVPLYIKRLTKDRVIIWKCNTNMLGMCVTLIVFKYILGAMFFSEGYLAELYLMILSCFVPQMVII